MQLRRTQFAADAKHGSLSAAASKASSNAAAQRLASEFAGPANYTGDDELAAENALLQQVRLLMVENRSARHTDLFRKQDPKTGRRAAIDIVLLCAAPLILLWLWLWPSLFLGGRS